MNAKGNGFAPHICDVAGLAVIFVMQNRILPAVKRNIGL
jgi:hypothetical protein